LNKTQRITAQSGFASNSRFSRARFGGRCLRCRISSRRQSSRQAGCATSVSLSEVSWMAFDEAGWNRMNPKNHGLENPKQILTCLSIFSNVSKERSPKGLGINRVFSTVVGWSHFAQDSESSPPSPASMRTLILKFPRCIVVIGITQTSRACVLSSSIDKITAGRGLSILTR